MLPGSLAEATARLANADVGSTLLTLIYLNPLNLLSLILIHLNLPLSYIINIYYQTLFKA